MVTYLKKVNFNLYISILVIIFLSVFLLSTQSSRHHWTAIANNYTHHVSKRLEDQQQQKHLKQQFLSQRPLSTSPLNHSSPLQFMPKSSSLSLASTDNQKNKSVIPNVPINLNKVVI